jgi:hypothetical protein
MSDSFILLKTYFYPNQAELDLNKLKSEGIEAYLNDENMGSYSFLGAATGGVKLVVAKKDLERAQKILSDEQA